MVNWSPGGPEEVSPPSSTEGATTQCVKGAAALWPEEDVVGNVLPDLGEKAAS